MSVLPTVQVEQTTLDTELLMLKILRKAVEETEPVPEKYWNTLKHVQTVFEHASDTNDFTGRRERFVKWFSGREADEVITTMKGFLNNYVSLCKTSKKTVPISFDSASERDVLFQTIIKLQNVMNIHSEGFVVWPPPRNRSCF